MADSSQILTLREIAEAAGTSKSTVSRALRGDPRISEAVRNRVQETARKLGYQPDPAFAVLSAYRNRQRVPGDYGTIAILNAWEAPRENELPKFFQMQLSGIRERAAQLGYRIDLLPVPSGEAAQKRFSRMLLARGIQGVIVGPVPVHRLHLHLSWEAHSAVAIGSSLTEPVLSYSANDFAGNVEAIYTRLREMGYQKIGFCNDRDAEIRGKYQAVTGYLKCLIREGKWMDDHRALILESSQDASVVEWVRQHRFDGLICGSTPVQGIERQLKMSGYVVPRDIGLAVISVSAPRQSGMLENPVALGTAAMSLLHNQMVNRERGVPDQRHLVLIPGIWQPGRTLRSAPARVRNGDT